MKEKYQMPSNNEVRMPAAYCDFIHVFKSFSKPVQLYLNKELQIQSSKIRAATFCHKNSRYCTHGRTKAKKLTSHIVLDVVFFLSGEYLESTQKKEYKY